MPFHRFGHMDKVLVKEGDNIKKGQKLGTVGTGNNQFSAHLHYDRPYKTLPKWTGFVFGMTKDQVRQSYLDSRDLEAVVFPAFHHYGWRYLELATYGTKKCYHPGGDLNGIGAGNADLGMPFFSPCDGKVVYCYAGTGTNGGWGKLLVIEEAKDPGISTSIPVMGETTTTAVPVQNAPNGPKIDAGEAKAPEGGTGTPPPEIADSVAPKEMTIKEAILALLKYIFGGGWKK